LGSERIEAADKSQHLTLRLFGGIMESQSSDFVEDAIKIINREWISASQFFFDAVQWLMEQRMEVRFSMLDGVHMIDVLGRGVHEGFKAGNQSTNLHTALAWVVLRVKFKIDEAKTKKPGG
jgi:hypothetical protein